MKTLRLIGFGLFAVLLCFTFASCSNDDNDEGGNNLIVGWWQPYSGNESKVHIKKDGTFDRYYKDPYDSNATFEITSSGTWSYDENRQTWARFYKNSDGEITSRYVYTIHLLTDNAFHFSDISNGDKYTWIRIKE